MIKAQWKKLVMANYIVNPLVLGNYLPFKTEHDRWHDQCYMSLVGFMFMNTSVLGIKIPFHINFEEVNLRFYVLRPYNGGWKRGVVFIKEIVPLPAVTLVANAFFKEHYQTLPMKHSWISKQNEIQIEYQWKSDGWNSLKIIVDATKQDINPGTKEEFFTDQHWGYTKVNEDLTLEYEVAHTRWEYYKTRNYSIDVDFGNVYGENFSFLSKQKPDSVFLAEGSEITLKRTKN